MNVIEISRTRFDRAEEQLTSKSRMMIEGNERYGFFVETTFYYTVANKYYGVFN